MTTSTKFSPYTLVDGSTIGTLWPSSITSSNIGTLGILTVLLSLVHHEVRDILQHMESLLQQSQPMKYMFHVHMLQKVVIENCVCYWTLH